MPGLERPTALILNFTGNVYHWGCHGTSSEIYQSLLERGYQVNWHDVRSTHALTPHPESEADFGSVAFVATFFKIHPYLEFALTDADVVVVNGEGTLHRSFRPPLNLLFLMHAARNIFRKPVHLINHSFFPSGGEAPDTTADGLYGRVARTLTRVVPREPASRRFLARLGVDCPQGFDCLPRFIARHGFTGASRPAGPLLLSGGVNMNAETAARVAAAVRPHLETGRRAFFLAGAKGFPAPEDARIHEWMRAGLPELEWLETRTMGAWLEAIGSASCLVSGRYHHSLAAATLGTPFVAFPSNTPKVDATCAFLELPPPIAYDDPAFIPKVTEGVAAALAGRAPQLSPAARQRMLDGAEANFAGL
jgi:hypothetical protein